MSATRLLTLLATAAIVVAACSSAYSSPAPTAAGAGAGGAGASAAAGVTIGTAKSASFGTVLTGPSGLTLYTFAGPCTGDCATEWPPLTGTGQPMAGPGVTGQLGTTTRADGSTQVTYGGVPLYYWEGDKKAGDVTGDGIDGFSVATVGGTGAAPAASPAAPSGSQPSKYGY
jgi:predicted lipoprotein with Yx(FWY)xxD motif